MTILFIKSTLTIIVIYTLYISLLSKENMPVFKRFFLISGLLFSIIVPFINLSINTSVSQFVRVESTQPSFENIWIVYTLYVLGSFILSIRFVMNLLRLLKLKKDNRKVQLKGYDVVLINNKTLPFSFFNYIFIDNHDYIDGKISKEVLLHEIAHVRQKHSIDIVFIELLQIMFWFNPFIYLIKKEMKLNHEYLADKGVVNSGIAKHYFQKFLLNTVAINSELSLTSCFSAKLTKKRLLMLNIGSSPVRRWLKLSILIPTLIYCGISLTYSQSLDSSKNEKLYKIDSSSNINLYENNPIIQLDFLNQGPTNQQNHCDDYCQDTKEK